MRIRHHRRLATLVGALNGAHLLSTSDAGSRRGSLPVTLVLPGADHFAGGPYWEASASWAEVGH